MKRTFTILALASVLAIALALSGGGRSRASSSAGPDAPSLVEDLADLGDEGARRAPAASHAFPDGHDPRLRHEEGTSVGVEGSVHLIAAANRPAGAAGNGAPDPAEAQADAPEPEVPEDELINASDNIPEQRQWRRTWTREHHDAAWTQGMRAELGAKTDELLQGELQVTDLSCRATICRAILKFDSDRDAMAFQEAPHDPQLHYEYQSFDPGYDGSPHLYSEHRYELLVKRPTPPGHVAPPPDEDGDQVAAAEVPEEGSDETHVEGRP